MTTFGLVQLFGLLALLLLTVRPLGGYMQRVFAGDATTLSPLLRPIETAVYRLAGVKLDREQGWSDDALAFLLFHLVGMLLLYLLLRLQDWLPLNPAGQAALSPDLALNTAISFATNTSWQSYGGETTLSHLSEMAGIAVQSFLSGAAGIAVAIALIRGFVRHGVATIGNFWVDVTRATLYVMLPVCVVAAVFLAWQGVPQSSGGPINALSLEGARQSISVGPVASQEAVKLLSGDGGGFLNAQSAHPFDNPTALTNLLSILLMPLIGAALTNCFGRMACNERQGWALLAAMLVPLLAGAVALHVAEGASNPLLSGLGLDAHPGNLEGKELRFGVLGSALFSEFGTATSSGAVNAMQDSYLPFGGMVLLANMMLDEVIIGGPGSGLFGMLLYALVSVFIGGLMIGRTPEYIGNKIEAREMKLAVLAILAVPAALLSLTALGLRAARGAGWVGQCWPARVFRDAVCLYFGGQYQWQLVRRAYDQHAILQCDASAGHDYRPLLHGCSGAGAGGIAGDETARTGVGGHAADEGTLWVGLLIGVIVIVGGLSYLPALALGPIAEQLAMVGGAQF